MKELEEVSQNIAISLNTAANSLLHLFNSGTGGYDLTVQVLPHEVVESTGLISVQSGRITYNDVSRAQEAALSIKSDNQLIVPLGTSWRYELDDGMQTNSMPIGFPSSKLIVAVKIFKMPANQYQKWSILSSATSRWMNSFVVELLD